MRLSELEYVNLLMEENGIQLDTVESFNVYTATASGKQKVILRMKNGTAKVLTGEKNEATTAAP